MKGRGGAWHIYTFILLEEEPEQKKRHNARIPHGDIIVDYGNR